MVHFCRFGTPFFSPFVFLLFFLIFPFFLFFLFDFLFFFSFVRFPFFSFSSLGCSKSDFFFASVALHQLVISWCHLVISDDQVESRLWWVAGGSSHTFVAESPDECARAVMGVTPQSSLFPLLSLHLYLFFYLSFIFSSPLFSFIFSSPLFSFIFSSSLLIASIPLFSFISSSLLFSSVRDLEEEEEREEARGGREREKNRVLTCTGGSLTVTT